MKKYQEFLTEVNRRLSEKKLNEFIEHVKSKCKPFLKKIQNNIISYPLYRGMKKAPIIFIGKKVRTNRKPTDTKLATHKKFNIAFDKGFGIKARSDCLFIAGSFKDARYYGDGTAHIIFPEGKFDFLWSPSVKDLYLSNVRAECDHGKLSQEEINDLIKRSYIKNKSLTTGIKSGNEIMIKCKSYSGIDVKYIDKIVDRLK